MGQAKQRGTIEQRQTMAIARNFEIKRSIHKLPRPMRELHEKLGTQAFCTRLVQHGMLIRPDAT